MPLTEILFEIQRIGAIVRVCAIDGESGTEIVFQAPSSTNNVDLKRLATKKLQYVLNKQVAAKGRNSGKKV